MFKRKGLFKLRHIELMTYVAAKLIFQNMLTGVKGGRKG